MRRSRFEEEQIIGVLREQEAGSATADVCRKHGISPAPFYRWKSKFGGLAEERLQVRRRGGRKRALGTRAPIAAPDGPNERWSLDFVSDSLSDGRRIRVLCVVDDCTRECLGLVADTSLSGLRMARELDAIA